MASRIFEKRPFPAPILTLIHIAIAILLGKLIPLPIPVLSFGQWLGLGLTMFGFVLGLFALMEFKRVRALSDTKKRGGVIVSSGVYRYTRNPVYLGFVFMLIGVPLNSGNYWGIILAWPLIVFMNNLVIEREEAYLENRYKKQFTDYRSKVRRWL